MTSFYEADPARTLGMALIADHYPHLEDVRIEYVFRDNTPVAGGREIWGKARKVTGLPAFLAAGDGPPDDFFVVELSKPVWDGLDDDQRRALVDHELCHCIVKTDGGDVKLSTKTHDVEEFREIIERHGLWRPDVEAFASTIDAVLE